MAKDILEKIYEIKKVIKDNFVYIDKLEDRPKRSGGHAIEKIYKDPRLVFHFLEFLFEKEYVDLDKKEGVIFIDDKTTWEFLIKTEYGFITVYDWKDYSVSIGSTSSKVNKNLHEKALLLKSVIDDNVDAFLEFRKIKSKKDLEENPFENFMKAWVSMDMMFGFSLEEIKDKNFGFIESLILLVSLIDTMLRYSILLTRINVKKIKEIDESLLRLFLQKSNKYLSEREIFKIAKREVNFRENDKEKFFQRANDLYDFRNKAVHRYAITNIQYIEIKNIVNEYKDLRKILSDLILKLEKEQVDLGVGFLKKEQLIPLPDDKMRKILDDIFETKVDSSKIFKKNPEREVVFSDKFKGGVNPKLKKLKKELEKRI